MLLRWRWQRWIWFIFSASTPFYLRIFIIVTHVFLVYLTVNMTVYWKFKMPPLEWFFRLQNLIISRPHLSTYITITSTLPVMFRVVFKVLLFIYKSLHNQSPPYIKDLFSLKPAVINNALRSPLFVPTVNCSTLGDRTFAQAAPVL